MSETYRFLTTKRSHLFGLSKFLVGGIDPAFFDDPRNPVIITVRGSYRSGKKILPDAAHLFLLRGNVAFEGRENHDEYRRGRHRDREISIAFVNAAWGGGYSRTHLGGAVKGSCAQKFLAEIDRGGLVFIHNAGRVFTYRKSWIDIWMEERDNNLVGMFLASRLRKESRAMREEFERLSGRPRSRREGDWVRYVRVTVNSPALLDSPLFRKRLETLVSGGARETWPGWVGKKIGADRLVKNPVLPVWGVNMPRKLITRPL